MKFRPFYLALITLAILTTSSDAFSLEPFYREYKSTFAGFSAKSSRELKEVEPGVWELSLKARNWIARYEETSRFTLSEEGYPIPQMHYFKGRLLGVNREEITHFDWQDELANWQRGDDQRTAELHEGVVDRILYQILVPMDVESGKEVTTYEFVNRGDLRTYQFEILGEETMDFDNREINAVKLERIYDDEEKQTAVWIAPDLGYEIVKIVHHDEDGADYLMELKPESLN
jgi:hypothetical protein